MTQTITAAEYQRQNTPSEHSEQKSLFEWAAHNEGACPALRLLFAIPNGQVRRNVAMEPGIKVGIPDVFLACPSGPFAGLFIEMKAGTRDLRPKQDAVLRELDRAGYAVFVAHRWQQAAAAINEYLSEPQHFISGV